MRQYLGSIYWYSIGQLLSTDCCFKVWDLKILQFGFSYGFGIGRMQGKENWGGGMWCFRVQGSGWRIDFFFFCSFQ